MKEFVGKPSLKDVRHRASVRRLIRRNKDVYFFPRPWHGDGEGSLMPSPGDRLTVQGSGSAPAVRYVVLEGGDLGFLVRKVRTDVPSLGELALTHDVCEGQGWFGYEAVSDDLRRGTWHLYYDCPSGRAIRIRDRRTLDGRTTPADSLCSTCRALWDESPPDRRPDVGGSR